MENYRMNYLWARLLAFLQCIIGVLLFSFGIVDKVENEFFTSVSTMGIWIGLWVIVTGVLGLFASSRKYEVPEQSLVGTHMGFSIASVVFAATIIISYTIALALEVPRYDRCRWKYDWHSGYSYSYEVCPSSYQKGIRIGISVVLLLLGIAEFGVGIGSAIYMCKACACCNRTDQGPGQVMHMRNVAGGNAGQYVVAQPVMVPNQQMAPQAGRPMVAITQPRGQPMAQGQPVMVVSQLPGQSVVQGQPVVAVSQLPGQPVVQGQPVVLLSQPRGQPVVQGQAVVAASQQSGQPVVQGQPVVVASQASGQPVVQGQPVAAVIVSQQSGQPVVSSSQADEATETQGPQEQQPESAVQLVNV